MTKICTSLRLARLLSTICAGIALTACSAEEASEGPTDQGPPPVPPTLAGTSVATTDEGVPIMPSTAPVSPMAAPPVLLVEEEEPPEATGIRPGDAVDLLFVVDNSTSMGDKQLMFKQAVPALIDEMVNPPCIIRKTQEFLPFEADGTCPAGSAQIFPPVEDIHIAMVSTSLGSHGLLTDQPPDSPVCNDEEWRQNDKAHFIGKVRPGLPSYQNQGFLVWDTRQEGADPAAMTNKEELIQAFQQQVDAIGEDGCGFEAPLEAAYRFLVEPDPFERLERVPCSPSSPERLDCVEPVGTDMDLLAQRAAFLRPDSAVVVLYLTDENDCSVTDRRQGYFTVRPTPLAGGTTMCSTDPNNECCHSCLAAVPDGCPAKDANGCELNRIEFLEGATEDALSEAFNLRCFNQKRRFGVDFLYSTRRYIAGFQNDLIVGRDNKVENAVPNPLFKDGRTPDRVFVVGIIGTPWQDTTQTPEASLLKVSRTEDLNWNLLLPHEGKPAEDPHNRESMQPRSGIHPVTKEGLSLTDVNQINGHERDLKPGDYKLDDLQYACIFPLATPKDCSVPALPDGGVMLTDDSPRPGNCDCTRLPDPGTGEIVDYATGNPLCLQEDGTYSTNQRFAKAYPAPRMLEVLQAMGEQGVLSSICPKNALEPAQQDFGYRPAIRALLLNLATNVPAQ